MSRGRRKAKTEQGKPCRRCGGTERRVHNAECIQCARAGHRVRAAKRRRAELGVSFSEYERMLQAQRGLCAICFLPETTVHNGTVRALSIDHNHATGKVRGLLCAGCNAGIGMFGDDPTRMRAAAEYVAEGGQIG